MSREIRMAVLVEGPADDHGRQPFTVFWADGGRDRAQCFRAKLAEYEERWTFYEWSFARFDDAEKARAWARGAA